MKYVVKDGNIIDEYGKVIANLQNPEDFEKVHQIMASSKAMFMLINKFILDLDNGKFKTKSTYNEFKKLVKEINHD